MTLGKIGIVGCGLVGSSWATIFSSGGFDVQLYDISEAQIEKCRENISKNLAKMEEGGLRRGKRSSSEAMDSIRWTTSLEEVLKDAIYVQESTVENLEFRQKIFSEMDKLASKETIIASSSSTIPASLFTENLKNRERCLIVHPVNPPLFLPLTELVPAPWTSKHTVDRAAEIMTTVGQEPIKLNREVLGFAVNRLQYALLAESWRLVADDVLSVEDLDKVMKCGLGPRYAFYGPLETTHLNANGIRDYYTKYAPALRMVLADFGPTPSFTEEDVIQKLETSMEKQMPVGQIGEWQGIREEKLAAIAQLKRES